MRNNKGKVLALLLAALLTAGLFSGCGLFAPKAQEQTAEPVPAVSDAAKDVMAAIEAIPELKPDGSNAEDYWDDW